MTVSFDFNSTQAQFHQYSFLVDRIVQKIASKYPHHGDTKDMMQFGYIGLIEAIDAFPIDKGISFTRYASIRIQGRIVGKRIESRTFGEDRIFVAEDQREEVYAQKH